MPTWAYIVRAFEFPYKHACVCSCDPEVTSKKGVEIGRSIGLAHILRLVWHRVVRPWAGMELVYGIPCGEVPDGFMFSRFVLVV